MKILENVFLVLAIALPILFVLFAITNKSKMRSKKAKSRILRAIIVSLILNLSIFGGLKMFDKKSDTSSKNEGTPINNVVKPNETEKTNDNDEKEAKEAEAKNNSEIETPQNTTKNGFKIENRNGVTYIDGYLVVNKTYSLPEDYIPTGTHKAANSTTGVCADCIIEEAYNAFQKLQKDIASAGYDTWIQSGYRSYSYQAALYNGYTKANGKTAADTFSARPGHSEHQSGYAFDVCSKNYPCITSGYNNTPPANWLQDNCYKYGFIIRYPKDKNNETGYMYESWHLRYVGTDLASKLYNNGDWITLETYFGITSKYND